MTALLQTARQAVGKQSLAAPIDVQGAGNLMIADKAPASCARLSRAASMAAEQASDGIDLPLLAFTQTPRPARRDRIPRKRTFVDASAAQLAQARFRLPDSGLMAEDRALDPFRHARRWFPTRIDLLDAPDRGLGLAVCRGEPGLLSERRLRPSTSPATRAVGDVFDRRLIVAQAPVAEASPSEASATPTSLAHPPASHSSKLIGPELPVPSVH